MGGGGNNTEARVAQQGLGFLPGVLVFPPTPTPHRPWLCPALHLGLERRLSFRTG